MRWLGILVRILGWLLAPLVAWAVSFCGAWMMLETHGSFGDPRHAIYAAGSAALLTGTLLMYGWIQLLRRSPRLRHSLHVNREGLPVLEEAGQSTTAAEDEASEAGGRGDGS
jgi:hypothetical protein